MHWPSLPLLSEIENIRNDRRNEARRSSWKPASRNILYIIKYIESHGGIETRVRNYAEALKNAHCQVVFVSERNDNEALKRDHTCLQLNFHAKNAGKSLLAIIEAYRIDIAEFHIWSHRFLYSLDIGALKRRCRVGCVVHCEIPALDPKLLNAMDYRIFISDLLRSVDYARLDHYKVLPNAVHRTHPVWRYKNQRKALIISRIAKDKFDQLCAAVGYCRSRGIPFTIAGSTERRAVTRRLKRRFDLDDDVFTGIPIDTVEYLKAHVDDYLMVAGVGQVLLEAGALGYPCLLASDAGAEHASFLTRDNIRGNFGRNLTAPSPRRKDVCVREMDLSDLAAYDISEIIRNDYALSERIAEYLDYIDGL